MFMMNNDDESKGQDQEFSKESAATLLVPPSPLELAAIGAPYNSNGSSIDRYGW
jgi:hypothetical protein